MSLVLLLIGATAWAQDAQVLLIGNSYTSRNQLPALIEEQLVQDVPGLGSVAVTAVTAGGKTLSQHLADADGTNGDTAVRQALVTAPSPWAFVLVQEQSQTPGFPPEDSLWTASRDAFLGLDALIAQTGADTVLYQTWGRREGDPQNPDLYPTYEAMQDRITAGYAGYAEAAARPVTTAPAGEGFRAFHELGDGEGTRFWELYSADGSHPSIAGSQLVAATVVAAWTGRRPSPLPSLVAQGLEAERQQDAIDAVVALTVDRPLDGSWPWVHPWSEWSGAIDGDLQRPVVWLDGSATADEVRIGDGTLLLLDGAALKLGALRIEGTLDWRGGALEAATVEGDLVLPAAGELAIDAPMQVHGSVSGAGTLTWSGNLDGADELAILTADSLDLDGIRVELDAWEQRGDTLYALAGDERTGCGCATGGASPAWLATLLALLLAGCQAVERRSPVPPG